MEDLRFRHPGGEVFEHVVHGDAKPPDAGLAAALARLDGDALPVVHDREGTAQGPTRSNCGRDQRRLVRRSRLRYLALTGPRNRGDLAYAPVARVLRSEERRVGKEGRVWWGRER